MKTQAATYENLRKGITLTDQELREGYAHFHSMYLLLNQSGPVFQLAASEAAVVAEQLDSYIRERAMDLISKGSRDTQSCAHTNSVPSI